MKTVPISIVKKYAFAKPEFWERGATCYCQELALEVLQKRIEKKKPISKKRKTK